MGLVVKTAPRFISTASFPKRLVRLVNRPESLQVGVTTFNVQGHLAAVIAQGLSQTGIREGQYLYGQDTGVLRPGLADGHGCHRNAARHLYRGVQCVDAVQGAPTPPFSCF